MSAYTVAEDGTSVTVCAELSNVLPVSGTTAEISTSFMVTDGDAGKRQHLISLPCSNIWDP